MSDELSRGGFEPPARGGCNLAVLSHPYPLDRRGALHPLPCLRDHDVRRNHDNEKWSRHLVLQILRQVDRRTTGAV